MCFGGLKNEHFPQATNYVQKKDATNDGLSNKFNTIYISHNVL